MVIPELFVLNYAGNLWGVVIFGPPERKLVRLPLIFILFSIRYNNSRLNKNKFLRFSMSDFFINDLI